MSATAKTGRRSPPATARRRGAEEADWTASADADERLRAFAETAGLWLWELNRNLRFRFVSHGWRELTGLEPLGLTPWEVWGRFDCDQRQWRRLRESMEAGRPIDGLRLGITDPSGRCRYLELRGRPFSENGRFSGYRGSMVEVTKQVEAERRAAAAQRVLVDAIESMPAGVVLWSPAGETMLCNNHYLDLFPPGRRPPPQLCAPGEVREVEVEGRWLHIRHHRMEDGGVVGIYTDVTELRAAKEKAEAANRAKSRFLAAASHDIRQPLQAMGLFVAALAQTPLSPQAAALVEKLGNSLESLESLLGSLLDVSKLEAGVVEPDVGDVPLGSMLRRLAEEFAPLAQNEGLRFRAVPTKAVVRSDPVLLERILRNLLANAIRYTLRGGVLVGCRRRGRNLRIEVWDTGIGIPPGQQKEIFREFHRLPRERRGRGFGLGLAIVERAADLLGHEVTVRSREGQGSVFAVIVPRACADDAGRKAKGTPSYALEAEAGATKVEVE